MQVAPRSSDHHAELPADFHQHTARCWWDLWAARWCCAEQAQSITVACARDTETLDQRPPDTQT
jgi:hypothetical protein